MKMTLRAARANKNLSQEQVAELMGVSRIAVWKWENGESYPRVANLKKLCFIYGVDLGDLEL